MVEMGRSLWVRLLRAGPVAAAASFVLAAGALSAQEPAARAYLEPPEVEVGEQFVLKIEVSGVSEVEELMLPDEFPFARPPSEYPFALAPRDHVLPYNLEITPAAGQSAGSVTISYSLVAEEAGFFEFQPFRITADGRMLETEPVMLFVTPPSERPGATARAWTEPVTLVVSDEHREIEAYAGVNTEQAWVGGEFVLVVEVTGAREFDEEPVLPDISAFAELQRGGSQGRGRFTVSRNYHFHALEPGEFEIGPVTVTAAGQTVLTEPVRLAIAEGPPDPVVSPEDLRTNVVADKHRVYVGEPVLVSYQLLARDEFGFEGWSVREGTTFTPPTHEDFQVHDLGRQPDGWRRVSVDGRSYRSDTDRLVAFVPRGAGEKTIGPAEYRVQVNRRELADLRLTLDDPTRARTMGEWTPMTLATDPVVVEVVPLPTEGRPESFRGQVGRVEVASWLNRTEAAVGDTVTLRVALSGSAYIQLTPDPELILPEGLAISEPEISDDPRRLQVDLPGVRTLVYRLIPTREGSYRIPAVEVSWFDPAIEEYGVSRAQPFDISVGPAGRE